MHKETFRWMADGPDVPFIGLSATPWSRDLGKYYDALIRAYPVNTDTYYM
jgi:DNA repair protein RadD